MLRPKPEPVGRIKVLYEIINCGSGLTIETTSVLRNARRIAAEYARSGMQEYAVQGQSTRMTGETYDAVFSPFGSGWTVY